MPRPFPDLYTVNHTHLDDGAISFECSTDDTVWPWLKLGPAHPILLQTINFWASVDCGEFLGNLEPGVWTALTQTEWACGPANVGLPVRGRYSSTQEGERGRFHLAFFDADDQQIVRMSGQGVTFRTRNFESWRDEAKEKIVKPDPPPFDYAPHEAVGVATAPESFLAPLSRTDGLSTSGLITKANGLRPAHPYIGGSGDHVNSTHMGEVGRQFAALMLEQPLRIHGGEMDFMHYVELGTPFDVALTAHDEAAQAFSLIVHQAGRACTRISMQYAPIA